MAYEWSFRGSIVDKRRTFSAASSPLKGENRLEKQRSLLIDKTTSKREIGERDGGGGV